MSRVYQQGVWREGELIQLQEKASHHLARVLRMQLGEKVTVFNGENVEFYTQIVTITKRTVALKVESYSTICRESPCQIHLYQAVSKGERMEFVVQKAVELGVWQITPIITARSVVKLNQQRWQKKHAQWQDIAINACEQCGRNTIPLIHPVRHFTDALATCQQSHRLILHPAKQDMHNKGGGSSVALFIGPEGGFSDDEIKHAEKEKCSIIQLGPRVLRTETAALCALSLIQAKLGDIDYEKK
jgi:16S rRNA (uracil1498-N3)-methyltransferase